MTSSTVNCPLCYQPAFSSLAALSMSLINVTTRPLDCPLCHESLSGLDKFTIHVFGHALSHKSPQHGVFKVIAGTFSQNAAPIDVGLPVLIRHIDASPTTDGNHVLNEVTSNLNESRLYISSDGDASPKTDESLVLKQGSTNLDESRLYISSDDDKNNNNEEKETKTIDDRMLNSSPKCENHNMKSITSNHEGQTSINRDNNTSNSCKKSFSINDAGLTSINQDSNLSNNIMENVVTRIDSNIGTNHVSDIKGIITRMDSNIGTNQVSNMEGIVTRIDSNIGTNHASNMEDIVTRVDSNIGTNNYNNASNKSVECITTEIESQGGTTHDYNIKSIVTNIDGHIGEYHDGDETINGSGLKYYSNVEEGSTFTTNYYDNNVKGGYKNSINNNGTPNYTDQVTREEHVDVDNDYNSSSIKDTDVPAPVSYRLNSSTISKFSEDNSNDLLKNLEPFIKYGTPKFDKIGRNQICVKGESDDISIENRRGIEGAIYIEGIEGNSSNVKGDFTNLVGHNTNSLEINSKFIENRSNFMDYSTNNMENDSNLMKDFPNLVQTCGNAKGDSSYVTEVLKINEVTCGLEGSNTSVEATSSNLTSSIHHNILVEDIGKPFEMVPSSDRSPIHHNIVVNDIEDEHYQVIPLILETSAICGSQNDTPPSKTKTSKKFAKGLKRKFSKKSTDSSMTTQGVQTMEESFTKNNNTFGKFSIIDKMSEDPVQDLDMERNVLSDGRSFVSDGGNIVSEAISIVSDSRNIDSDRRNTVSKGESFVSDSNKCNVTFENCTNFTENDVTAVCDLCLFTFPDEKILQMHKKLVHNDFDEQKKTFSCHLCSKSFNMRGSLMVHRRVAHPVISGGQVSLKNIERIKEMKASTSLDETTPQFCCKTCGKSFKKEQHLTQHERTHELKQWECDICSKVFSTKYFLKKHKRLHTGEMPYTCATCGKSFTFQQSYHKHLLYHSDEKPHVCAECGRAFKELSTLHNHQRIHTGEKPFACETCGKCFRQRVSYLVHRRIHTGVMPYKCTICNKSFRYKVSERTHKCNNATQGQVVSRINMVVEKLQKLEEKNTISNQESFSSMTCSLEATPTNTATTNQIAAKPGSQQHMNHSAHLDNPNSLEISDNCPGFWSNSSPLSTNHQPTNESNIFSAENSDDFLSFVLTPTFSPSEQFQNLTLSPNSAQNREREMDEKRNAVEGTMSNSVDGYRSNSFETTINEESLRDLLDHVDVL
ncbi:uncharacterized protein LOC111044974 [Nilaparvata lugens]|uniref:uncharacterized protein LOC111044974 n=1 Tax=Nilaparvata lugens TaxID=108931 RepID=UPI00193CE7EE|nr:uncharacterized protein LOC111044974 [Nilaparvata lugens]